MALQKLSAVIIVLLMLVGDAAAMVYQYFDEEGTLIVTNMPHGRGQRGVRPGVPVRRSSVPGGYSYEYYDVAGGTYQEAVSAALASGPLDPVEGRRYPAQTRWTAGWAYRIAYTYRFEGNILRAVVTISDITMQTDITVVLPSLAAGIALNHYDRQLWDRFVTALDEHERDHVSLITDRRYRDEAVSAISQIHEVTTAHDPAGDPDTEIRSAVESETARIGHTVLKKIKAQNDAYDRITEHGLHPEKRAAFFGG